MPMSKWRNLLHTSIVPLSTTLVIAPKNNKLPTAEQAILPAFACNDA